MGGGGGGRQQHSATSASVSQMEGRGAGSLCRLLPSDGNNGIAARPAAYSLAGGGVTGGWRQSLARDLTHHQRLELAPKLGQLALHALLLRAALAPARPLAVDDILDLLNTALVLGDCKRWHGVQGDVCSASRGSTGESGAITTDMAAAPPGRGSLDCCSTSTEALSSVSSGRTGRGTRCPLARTSFSRPANFSAAWAASAAAAASFSAAAAAGSSTVGASTAGSSADMMDSEWGVAAAVP